MSIHAPPPIWHVHTCSPMLMSHDYTLPHAHYMSLYTLPPIWHVYTHSPTHLTSPYRISHSNVTWSHAFPPIWHINPCLPTHLTCQYMLTHPHDTPLHPLTLMSPTHTLPHLYNTSIYLPQPTWHINNHSLAHESYLLTILSVTHVTDRDFCMVCTPFLCISTLKKLVMWSAVFRNPFHQRTMSIEVLWKELEAMFPLNKP
jgi:hypothetical protein